MFCFAMHKTVQCIVYIVQCTVLYCTMYKMQQCSRGGEVSPLTTHLHPIFPPCIGSSYILELRALPPIRGLNELDSWKPFLLTPSTAHVSQAIALSFNVVMSWTTANLNSSTLEKYGPSVVADQILWSVFIPKLPGYHL